LRRQEERGESKGRQRKPRREEVERCRVDKEQIRVEGKSKRKGRGNAERRERDGERWTDRVERERR
jgi:hypothetical protein